MISRNLGRWMRTAAIAAAIAAMGLQAAPLFADAGATGRQRAAAQLAEHTDATGRAGEVIGSLNADVRGKDLAPADPGKPADLPAPVAADRLVADAAALADDIRALVDSGLRGKDLADAVRALVGAPAAPQAHDHPAPDADAIGRQVVHFVEIGLRGKDLADAVRGIAGPVTLAVAADVELPDAVAEHKPADAGRPDDAGKPDDVPPVATPHNGDHGLGAQVADLIDSGLRGKELADAVRALVNHDHAAAAALTADLPDAVADHRPADAGKPSDVPPVTTPNNGDHGYGAQVADLIDSGLRGGELADAVRGIAGPVTETIAPAHAELPDAVADHRPADAGKPTDVPAVPTPHNGDHGLGAQVRDLLDQGDRGQTLAAAIRNDHAAAGDSAPAVSAAPLTTPANDHANLPDATGPGAGAANGLANHANANAANGAAVNDALANGDQGQTLADALRPSDPGKPSGAPVTSAAPAAVTAPSEHADAGLNTASGQVAGNNHAANAAAAVGAVASGNVGQGVADAVGQSQQHAPATASEAAPAAAIGAKPASVPPTQSAGGLTQAGDHTAGDHTANAAAAVGALASGNTGQTLAGIVGGAHGPDASAGSIATADALVNAPVSAPPVATPAATGQPAVTPPVTAPPVATPPVVAPPALPGAVNPPSLPAAAGHSNGHNSGPFNTYTEALHASDPLTGKGHKHTDHVSWDTSPSTDSLITVGVWVDAGNGLLTSGMSDAIDRAIATINAAQFDSMDILFNVVRVNDGSTDHNIRFSVSDDASGLPNVLGFAQYSVFTAHSGQYADGDFALLFAGEETAGGTAEVTILDTWNWYTGAAEGDIASNQFDFESVALHELLHLTGLGHDDTVYAELAGINADSLSVMATAIGAGDARRHLSDHDLATLAELYGPGQGAFDGGDGGGKGGKPDGVGGGRPGNRQIAYVNGVAIPEPATGLSLLGLGLLAAATRRRRAA